MKGFIIYCKADESKDEAVSKLDQAIKKARLEMEVSIAEKGTLAEETVRLSQKLDPLVAHKQRMLIYGC